MIFAIKLIFFSLTISSLAIEPGTADCFTQTGESNVVSFVPHTNCRVLLCQVRRLASSSQVKPSFGATSVHTPPLAGEVAAGVPVDPAPPRPGLAGVGEDVPNGTGVEVEPGLNK